jgi:hypothetical protein
VDGAFVFAESQKDLLRGGVTMKRFGIRYLLLALPVLALLIVIGCNSAPPPKEGGDGAPETEKPKGAKTELASTGWGTLTGKVTLAGDAPDMTEATKKFETAMKEHPNHDVCLSATNPEEKNPESWLVKKVDGEQRVKNVFVFLRAPENTYFKLPDGALDKAKDQTVVLDQPHCAFIPHALTLWPSYWDGKAKKEKPTGQKFEVKNSAPGIDHNTKWHGSSFNDGNETIKAGQTKEVTLKVDPKPVVISCSIHGWMNANAWVLDHPFATITDDKGEYKIENVPTGVPVQIVAWHEVAGFFTPGKTKGETVTLAKETSKNFEIPAQQK